MTDTIPKQVSSESESEACVESSKMSADQPEILSEMNTSNSVRPTTEAIVFANEINQDACESSGTFETFSDESSSTLVASQRAGSESEDKQPNEDGPTEPLIVSRCEDSVLPINANDNRTSEPPPVRPSYIQCLCCCYITTYNIHEDKQRVAYYKHYARKIRNSEFILLVLAALLLIPISSIYFGFIYIKSCPMNHFLPVMLILMGVVGAILIFVRLVTLSARRRLCNVKEPVKAIYITLIFMLVVFMATEMLGIYGQKPVFDNPKDPVFCEQTFYSYVYYMNFAVLVIGFFALLLHIPQKPYSEEQVVAQEHFDTI